MLKSQPPRATRDFLPGETAARNQVRGQIGRVAESYGFQEIETPSFENVELFLARSGPEIKSSMLTFHCDHEEFALRPEMTAPVCRVMASGALEDRPAPHKLYYIGSCFRYCRPQSGRFREFTQAGIELLGQSGAAADAEVIAVASQVIRRLGVRDSQLKIGSIAIFAGLLPDDLDADDKAAIIGHLDKLSSIDEKCRLMAKTGGETVLEELKIDRMELAGLQADCDYSGPYAIAERPDVPASEWADLLPREAEATFRGVWSAQQLVSDEVSDVLRQVSRLRGPLDEVHARAQSLLQGTPAVQALDDLLAVCRHVKAYDVGPFEVVLGIARGFTFYTSTVFEITSGADNGGRKYCGGGRYDQLVEEFGGAPMPAAGCGFRFDALVEDFLANNVWSPPRPYEIYLVADAEDERVEAIRLAEALRRQGLRVGVGTGAGDKPSEGDCERQGTQWIVFLPAEGGKALISNGSVTKSVGRDAAAIAAAVR